MEEEGEDFEEQSCWPLTCTGAKKHSFLNIDKLKKVPYKKKIDKNDQSVFQYIHSNFFSAKKEFKGTEPTEKKEIIINEIIEKGKDNDNQKIVRVLEDNVSKRLWYEVRLFSDSFYKSKNNWYDLAYFSNTKINFDPISNLLLTSRPFIPEILVLPECTLEENKDWFHIDWLTCK